jgi:AcrR family transcriptional regulator
MDAADPSATRPEEPTMADSDAAAPRTGARGPYRNGIERRRQIVDEAWRIFALKGYSTASLREIATAVGVTPAGLLRHFDTKEDLLTAVLDRWEVETQHLADVVDQGEGLAFFLDFTFLMRYHVEHPGLIELFLTLCAEASDPAHPARGWVAERYRRIVELGQRQLELAEAEQAVLPMTPEQREQELRTLYAMMDGLELQWISDPSLDLVGQFESAFAIVITRWTGRECTFADGRCRLGDRIGAGA